MKTVDAVSAAFGALRDLPAPAWLWWSSGAVPYAFALSWFVTEMGASAEAAEALPFRALLVASLYLWLGCAQVNFSSYVRASVSGGPPRLHSLFDVLRTTALIHVSALLVLPAGLMSVLGAPATFAFYQSASWYSGAEVTAKGVFGYALAAAGREPRTSAGILLMVILLAAVVFLNVFVLLFGGPFVLRTLTGQETAFTRNPPGMLNLATFSSALAISWLCLDPLIKTIFALRCFERDSIHSGADLRAALRRIAKAAPAAMLFVSVAAGQPAANEIERAIKEVSARPEFVWRTPRLTTLQEDHAFLRFSQDAAGFVTGAFRSIGQAVSSAAEALLRWLRSEGGRSVTNDGAGTAPHDIDVAVTVLLLLLAGLGAYVLIRLRRKAPAAVNSTPSAQKPIDLREEEVSPELLGGDEWLAMADDFARDGNLRMAARAVFLSLLATLGKQEVISIHKAKSNLDYVRELIRRTRGNEVLHEAFRSTVSSFERTWYGHHEITPQLFDQYRVHAMNTRNLAEQH